MGIRVDVQTTLTRDGSRRHELVVCNDRMAVLARVDGTATSGHNLPSPSSLATQAIDEIERDAREARAQLTKLGLLTPQAPSSGPYR